MPGEEGEPSRASAREGSFATQSQGEPPKDTPDLVPARMLNEFAYCPRLFYLEWVQGEWAESEDTLEGRFKHRRVEKEKGKVPAPGAAAPEDKIHARSLLLSAEKAGLIARIDLLEGEGNRVTPVDYKRGKKPSIPEGAYEPERVQLCAQGIILRENGYECSEGVLYFVESKERVTVPFDDALVGRTLALLGELRKTAASGKIPPPLVDSPKCPRCSLVSICLPDEVNALSTDGREAGEVRRLFPARDDALPVYVQAQGAVVKKRGDVLEVRRRDKEPTTVRLMEVSQLCLFGNPQLTTPTLRELCARGIPVCYFSFGGWFYGITRGHDHKNVELRRLQFAAAEDPARALPLARAFVEGKIRNCRTLLRRNHPDPPPGVLEELSRLAELASQARSVETLLGIEGAAANVYFAHFGGMLKPEDGMVFDFRERNRRPPKDPVNGLLSFAYALLTKDLTVTLMAVGYDPYLGFYHRPRYGRPALALDLMEEFRPIIADSTVLALINNGEIKPEDFIQRAGASALTPEGRKKVLEAYERRMDATITHPLFGYTISYRRVLEVQARLLGRHLAGELPAYPPFLTR